MQLFELFAKFTVDKQDFVKDMAEAEKTGQTTATKLSSSFDKLKKVLIGVVSVAAAKKAASAMMNVVAAAASVGDKIDKQSQALGMSRKAYQEWEYILGQSGASIDSLGVSMKTLNETILGGSEDASKALKEIGLSADGLAQLSQEDAFGQVVRALQALPAGARKSSLAVKLLGKNGQELLPLLNTSVEGVDALREEAERLGLYMSDDGVDAAVAYGDALDAMKRTFVGIKNTVATRVMPTMTNVFKIISDYAGNFHKNLKTAIETGDWAGLFSNIWTDVTAAAGDLWIRISDTVPQLWEAIQGKLSESNSPVLQAVADIMGTISALITEITNKETPLGQVFDTIKTKVDEIKSTALEKINEVLQWIAEPANADKVKVGVEAFIAAFAIGKLVTIFSMINPIKIVIAAIAAAGLLIYENWDGIQKFFEDLWTAVSTAVTDAWNAYTAWIDENILQNVEAAWSAVSEFFTGLWDGVKTAVTTAWEAVTSWFDATIVQNIESAWNGITEFFSGIVDSIGLSWETLTATVSRIISSIKLEWIQIVGWFQSKIINPIKGKWDAITSKVDEIVVAVKGAWEAIVTWFDDTIIKPISDAWEEFKAKFTGWIPGTKKATLQVDTVFNRPEGMSEEQFNFALMSGQIGNNAKGIDYVPYDNYVTRLHRGEMILNRSRADDYRNGNNNGVDMSSIVTAISAAVRDGLAQAEVVMDKRTVGAILTPEISRNVTNGMTARRFATT